MKLKSYNNIKNPQKRALLRMLETAWTYDIDKLYISVLDECLKFHLGGQNEFRKRINR